MKTYIVTVELQRVRDRVVVEASSERGARMAATSVFGGRIDLGLCDLVISEREGETLCWRPMRDRRWRSMVAL